MRGSRSTRYEEAAQPPFKKLTLQNFNHEFETDFENRKWDYPNRKWNYFSLFQSDKPKDEKSRKHRKHRKHHKHAWGTFSEKYIEKSWSFNFCLWGTIQTQNLIEEPKTTILNSEVG